MPIQLGPVLEKFLASLLVRLEEEKRHAFTPEEDQINPVDLRCRLLSFKDDAAGNPPDWPTGPLPPPWMVESPDLRSMVLKMQEYHTAAEAKAEEAQCEKIRRMFQGVPAEP